MNRRDPQLNDRLAAEYVLGAMSGQARKRFERLCQQSPEVRVMVERWTEKLVPIGLDRAAGDPSPEVWRAIEAQLDRPSPAEQDARASRWWFAPRSWFGPPGAALRSAVVGLVVGAGAIALILPADESPTRGHGMSLPLRPTTGDVLPDSRVGVLLDSTGRAMALVAASRDGTVATVKVMGAVPTAPDRELRLWLLAPDRPPAYLGLAPEQGATRIELNRALAPLLELPNAQFAISMEPRGAQHTAPASLPFVAQGPIVRSW